MIKVSPVAYKLPDNTVLTAEHSYEAVFEGVLRIETRLFIDDRFVGSMLGYHGKLDDLRLADEDCGVRGFIYRIDMGYLYAERLGVKRNDINMVVSELHIKRQLAFSERAEFLFDNLFRLYSDAGFSFDRAVYANVLLVLNGKPDYDLEIRHEKLTRRLKALVVSK